MRNEYLLDSGEVRREARDDLLQRFNLHFDTVPADTPDLLPMAQRLRYQVYCVENRYEDPARHPDALERDEFDSHAAHSLLVHRPTRDALGTVRLVLPVSEAPQESFAVQKLSDHPLLRGSRELPLQAAAEVSRFSLSREFGRRMAAMTQRGDRANPPVIEPAHCGPLMRLGLIQMLVRMSRQHGITHWLAVMEPRLLRMLAAMAIHFQPIGGLVEYHGWRQPCFCNVADVLRRVKAERPAFWNVLTAGGTL